MKIEQIKVITSKKEGTDYTAVQACIVFNKLRPNHPKNKKMMVRGYYVFFFPCIGNKVLERDMTDGVYNILLECKAKSASNLAKAIRLYEENEERLLEPMGKKGFEFSAYLKEKLMNKLGKN